MKLNKWLVGSVAIVVIATAALALDFWFARDSAGTARAEMLARLPQDPAAVAYLDLEQFRSSGFLSHLLAWEPPLPVEEDYAQFMQATDFSYERDLRRMAVGFLNKPEGQFVYGIADGRFNRKKIEDYAALHGHRLPQLDRTGSPLFALKLKNSQGNSFFTFLREGRIAWTNDPSYGSFFSQQPDFARDGQWKDHFERLAGSPFFVVATQDSSTAAALAQQAPGGFRSPQLASLLSQLNWLSMGARPDGNLLRLVAEGECETDTTIHQLKDFLGGMFLLLEAGLNGSKNRKELDPHLREAYLEVLRSARVDEVDRGSERSVRIVFEVSTEFLDAVHASGARAAPVTK